MPEGIHWLSSSFEATSPEAVDEVLEEANPDFIVNCAAITLTSPLANDPIASILVNSLFPHRLASLAHARGMHLVHTSTDGVFSGRKGNYTESDVPDPPDLYGRSKLLGEVTGENCLTIRTSFFGLNSRHTGLVEWLLQQQGKSIKGFTRSIFSALSTSTLARLVADVIDREVPLTGLYHVGGYPISKQDFLATLARKLELDVTIEPADVPILDRSLCSDRFWDAMQLPMPTLENMVADLKHQLGERLNGTSVEQGQTPCEEWR
jgi:dTDP-4-dehydrorhamnose reductase